MANIVHCSKVNITHAHTHTHRHYLRNVSVYEFIALYAGCHNSCNARIKLTQQSEMVNDLRDKQNHELHEQTTKKYAQNDNSFPFCLIVRMPEMGWFWPTFHRAISFIHFVVAQHLYDR